MRLGDLVPARFTEPENPIVMGSQSKPVETGNAVLYHLSQGCPAGRRCRAGITGLGEFELPLIGTTVPGEQWMYLIGIGAVAMLFLMSRGKK